MAEIRFTLPEELLAYISKIIKEAGLDFFIIGAIARDINLASHSGLHSPRTTEDLDIAIRVPTIEQFQTIITKFTDTGAFEKTSSNPIRLMYNKSIELDILPFGDLENTKREVRIPSAGSPFILSVPGLEEVRGICKALAIASGDTIHYCPLEGIVLLKLISWHENSGRTKDMEDISHICNVYFEYLGDEIYEEAHELLHQYDTNNYAYQQLVASHYLGRKVGRIISSNSMLLQIINDKLIRYDGVFRALLDGINDDI